MFLAGRCLGHANGEQRHTLIVTAQGNGSSLIRRPGESQIEPLGKESQQAPGPPLPDGRSLPLAGGPQQFSFLFRMLKPLAATRSSSATGAPGKGPARSSSASGCRW